MLQWSYEANSWEEGCSTILKKAAEALMLILLADERIGRRKRIAS